MRIKWFTKALADLTELRNYITEDNPQAAQQVADRIIQAVEALQKQPAIGRPGRVPGTRELVISGLPYTLPYRVRGQTVEILRVLHQAKKWPKRL